MSALWTAIVADAWGVVGDLVSDFGPLLALGIALAVFGVIASIFMRRD